KHFTKRITKIHTAEIERKTALTLTASRAHKIVPAGTTAKTALLLKVGSKLIITLAFVSIRQNLICFINFLKLGLVATLPIRMMLHRQFFESLFNLFSRRVFIDS